MNEKEKIKQAKYVLETNGDCLEFYNDEYFFLCDDCVFNPICHISRYRRTTEELEEIKRTKRIQLAKIILRETKLKKITSRYK